MQTIENGIQAGMKGFQNESQDVPNRSKTFQRDSGGDEDFPNRSKAFQRDSGGDEEIPTTNNVTLGARRRLDVATILLIHLLYQLFAKCEATNSTN